jgi:pilus assembly protein Flp/PilA
MKSLFGNFMNDESGATAIEYGLIAGLIGVAIITVVGEVGSQIQVPFTSAKNGLAKAPII